MRSFQSRITNHCSESSYRAPLQRASYAGRPRYDVSRRQIEFLVGEGFGVGRMARCLQVSSRTIRRRLAEFGMLLHEQFSNITDAQLDDCVRAIRSRFPRIGYMQMRSMLESDFGIRVQRHRVRIAMRRVDAAGAAIRWSDVQVRRRYSAYGANALWHIDTHHSLIRWRFVILGGIDGFSRLITYLYCADNNRASTVVQHFWQATRNYGVPSRVRSDRGGENYLVAVLMCLVRGPGRGSLIAGPSVHNQRIERLWRDALWFCLSTFYFLFYYMEEVGVLDPANELHLYALHYVFMPRINEAIERWMFAYNRHPLQTEHHSTPRQLWIESMLRLQSSGRTAVESIFSPENMPDYGIDWNGPCRGERNGNMGVPRIRIDFPVHVVLQLRNMIDPNGPSEVLGLDIYLAVVNFLRAASDNTNARE